MRISKLSQIGMAFAAVSVSTAVLINKLGENKEQKKLKAEEALQLRIITRGLETLKSNCQRDISNLRLGRAAVDKDLPEHLAGRGEILLYKDDQKEIPLTKISDGLANRQIFQDAIMPVAQICASNDVWLDAELCDGEAGHASIRYQFWRVTDQTIPMIEAILAEERQQVFPALAPPAENLSPVAL